MYKRVLVVGVVALIALLALGLPGRAAPPSQAYQVDITYPTDGMVLSGLVEIRGTAMHEQLDTWQVRYAPGSTVTANSQWVDIVMLVPTPVQNGVLCTWDTTTVPNGSYVLALAVWGFGDPNNPHVDWVVNLTVDNSQLPPTPLPTPEAPPATVEGGPTLTPVSVQLPATSTPRPTPALQEGEGVTPTLAAGEEEGGPRLVLDISALRSAFCTGGLIALLLFVLWGLYMLAKASIRWYLRESSGPWRR